VKSAPLAEQRGNASRRLDRLDQGNAEDAFACKGARLTGSPSSALRTCGSPLSGV
jgi:hypothetical protein